MSQQQNIYEKNPNDHIYKIEEERPLPPSDLQIENSESYDRQQQQSSLLQDEDRLLTKNPGLLQLIKSYTLFMNESSDVMLDMDVVLAKLLDDTRKLKPPSQ